jgi:hypothetical protein
MKAIYAPSKEICLTYIQISLRAEESAIMPVPTGGQCCVAARLRERTTSTLHSAVSSRVDPTPTLRRLYVACFISSCAIQMTSTVGRAAAPAINSRESILNSSERKKTKLNSKCRCCVVDSVIRHTMNSVEQYQALSGQKNLWLRDLLFIGIARARTSERMAPAPVDRCPRYFARPCGPASP